jgi:hypothetical protein
MINILYLFSSKKENSEIRVGVTRKMVNKHSPLFFPFCHKIISLFTPNSDIPPQHHLVRISTSSGGCRIFFTPVKKDLIPTLVYDHAIPLQISPS